PAVAEEPAAPVRGADPHRLRVVAAWRPLEAGEGLAAVARHVARGIERVDDVRVLRVDVHAAVVAALAVSNSLIVGGHLMPRRSAVVGSIKSPVADHEDPLPIRIVGPGDP